MRGKTIGVVGWVLGPPWIAAMRRRYGRARRRLTARERERMGAHFAPELLERVRVAEVERIELWVSARLGRWVQRVARRRGGSVAASPSGLTLDDLVLVVEGCVDPDSLLFHELVHVVQFAQLGRAGFAARYLAEWDAAGRRVDGIAMERDAYELQARFERGDAFDVAEEVASRLGRGQREGR